MRKIVVSSGSSSGEFGLSKRASSGFKPLSSKALPEHPARAPASCNRFGCEDANPQVSIIRERRSRNCWRDFAMQLITDSNRLISSPDSKLWFRIPLEIFGKVISLESSPGTQQTHGDLRRKSLPLGIRDSIGRHRSLSGQDLLIDPRRLLE